MFTIFGKFVLFLQSMVTRRERLAVLWARTVDEAMLIGVDSVFIVAIVSAFIGAVTCVQIAYNLTNPIIPQSTIGYMVREMTILELAPTITPASCWPAKLVPALPVAWAPCASPSRFRPLK